MAKNTKQAKNQPTADDLKAPLLAAVGAGIFRRVVLLRPRDP